jgi:pilus assembly protein CpaB
MKFARTILVIALALALITSVLVFRYLDTIEKEAEIKNMTEVIMSTVKIPPGTKITTEILRTELVDEELVQLDTITSYDQIVGQYAIDHILAGELISKERILEDSYSALEMNLKGNNRAITTRVEAQHSVANLIKPGDFVDLMVYLPAISDTNRIARPNITKLIMQKIEILAIDKNVFRTEQSDNNVEEVSAPASILVTLSIPVFDIEKLFLAEQEGILKLALRPIEDNNIYVTDGAVWEELFVNDQGQIKDLFPQYDVLPASDTQIVTEGFTYTRYIYYTIQPGDTLRSISYDFYGTEDNYRLLQRVNNIEDVNLIISGTGIRVPVLE